MGYEYHGISYKEPQVKLLKASGIGVAEIGARTAYGSFDKSESQIIRDKDFSNLDYVEDSELVNKLIWAYHHESVAEHMIVSYHIKDVSRAVLAEYSRHRLSSLTVKSTRYTGSSVLYWYIASYLADEESKIFTMNMINEDLLVTTDTEFQLIEWQRTYDMLNAHRQKIGDEEFFKLCLTSDQIKAMKNMTKFGSITSYYIKLNSMKNKRNVLDPFKYIVTDNWSTEIVSTWNVRSLKNFMQLRKPASAWFQIRHLADAMYDVLPNAYKSKIQRDI